MSYINQHNLEDLTARKIHCLIDQNVFILKATALMLLVTGCWMRTGLSKVRGNVRPITCHEGPEGEWRYNYTVSLTSALDMGGWLTPCPGLFTTGEKSGTHYRWAPGPGLTGAEKLAPTGIRTPDCPARSESLYRLSYPGSRMGLSWPQKQANSLIVNTGKAKGNSWENFYTKSIVPWR